MAYRQRGNGGGCRGRLIAGAFIIIGAVIAFSAYQTLQAPKVTPFGSIASSTPKAVTAIVTGTVAPGRGGIVVTTTPSSQMFIESPKVGLNTQITKLYYGQDDTWNVTFLGRFAGHLEGTPNMGMGGNFVLAGHVEMRDGSAGPFAKINQLKQGDLITINDKNAGQVKLIQYVVTNTKIVEPDNIEVIRNHGFEELTLITCQEYDLLKNTYQRRFIVHARPVKDVPNLVNQKQ